MFYDNVRRNNVSFFFVVGGSEGLGFFLITYFKCSYYRSCSRVEGVSVIRVFRWSRRGVVSSSLGGGGGGLVREFLTHSEDSDSSMSIICSV
jgi:hypothetical protein